MCVARAAGTGTKRIKVVVRDRALGASWASIHKSVRIPQGRKTRYRHGVPTHDNRNQMFCVIAYSSSKKLSLVLSYSSSKSTKFNMHEFSGPKFMDFLQRARAKANAHFCLKKIVITVFPMRIFANSRLQIFYSRRRLLCHVGEFFFCKSAVLHRVAIPRPGLK